MASSTMDGTREKVVQTFCSQLQILKGNVDYEISTFREETEQNTESVLLCKRRISASYEKYSNVANEYEDFLLKGNTTGDLEILESFRAARSELHNTTIATLRDIRKLLQRLGRTSPSSVGSRSRASTNIIKVKAKAEAAKAALEFATKEAELKKADAEIHFKRMSLQADLELLHRQKDVAVAVAEYNVTLEADSNKDVDSLLEIPRENTFKRTEQYVINHTGSNATLGNHEKLQDSNVQEQAQPAQPIFSACRPTLPTSVISSASMANMSNRRSIGPVHMESTCNMENPSNTALNEFSRFLLKKDLLMSRFSKFNDKPESYGSWKSSFQTITTELQVTAVEESELLVKWLGPDSSKFAHSIRISNANNPSRGLWKIWNRLNERYGSPELIETSLRTKLNNFQRITYKDLKRLYELQDILSEIASTKENPDCEKLLSYFDTSVGVNPIVNKLPLALQGKWRDKASNYKRVNGAAFPPFSFFLEFVSEQARKYNDPGFVFDLDNNSAGSSREKSHPQVTPRPRVHVSKTELTGTQDSKDRKCLIHKTNHSLSDCRTFKSKSIEDRHKFLKENGICFKCLESKDHLSRNCPKTVACKECNSSYHNTAMHNFGDSRSSNVHGGEMSSTSGPQNVGHVTSSDHSDNTVVKTNCMEICKGEFHGKSCAKILPVYISQHNDQSTRIKTYAILDEQSNRSLGKRKLFDMFHNVHEPEEYTLMSCSGRTIMNGRRMTGLVIESLDGTTKVRMPTVIECEEIPNNREEIATPDIALYHDHLRDISQELYPLDEESDILLLIGRDLPEVHHILDQRTGPPRAPYAQRTKLGWVVVGDVCYNKRHVSDSVRSYKTYISPSGRPSLFQPCPNTLKIREQIATRNKLDNCDSEWFRLGINVFNRTEHDDLPGRSIEDKIFLDIMDNKFERDTSGNWSAPLPFKPNREHLPDNFQVAMCRAKTLDRSLESDKVKCKHFCEFMQNLMDNDHAEVAPKLEKDTEHWYLPVFGIYHPKKPGKIRCVFDSSATLNGISLNKVLLQGPDLNNSLLGVLIRFRKNRVAASADIQQMFYSFRVNEKHRDFLRFMWHENNDMSKELISYRMTVHVFGNSPSPAVAIYGLRKCSESAEPDVRNFIHRHFYVDDGMISTESPEEMISLLTRTRTTLRNEGNIRLHKFASNSDEVMAALPQEDLAQDLKSLDLDSDSVPLQRSLGLYWDLTTDSFTYQISNDDKPYTRRGVLSTLNSIFDPLGFLSPVVIHGKIMLRELMTQPYDWDEPLPEAKRLEWERWKDSLSTLEELSIPRMYVPVSLSAKPILELHVFSDASEKAIGAVSYIRSVDSNRNSDLGFALGKAKVSPQHGHTIPRLELCAAVLAVEVAEMVVANIDIEFDTIKFYTDSKVVLGYIYNQTRRFYIYVENRVERIRKSTVPEQWNFVPTTDNPADQATRSIPSVDIANSSWLRGPIHFLERDCEQSEMVDNVTVQVERDADKEIRPVTVGKTEIEDSQTCIGSKQFEKFSSWTRLVRAIAVLLRAIRARKRKIKFQDVDVVTSLNESESLIVKTVQWEAFKPEITSLKRRQSLPRESSIIMLDPYLDNDGNLRVGGRLNKSKLIPFRERNPIILPGKCHVSKLIASHTHAQVKHQGRHLTEGAIRSKGYWIVGMKRLVSSIIHHCIQCRKLRRTTEVQKMADLPTERIEPAPPFTNIGVDVFGPWLVIQRKTRGGSANAKRWAVIFTCLTTRAVHIEVISEMSSNAFINAMRRFVAIRGQVSIFRSDRGTNFVGATDSLHINAINVEDTQVKRYMQESRTVWIFNPPHASHMGGAWERLIGVTRRILDAMLLETKQRYLTHDVLVTFMAEVSSILNHRPIVPISSDVDNPFVLSPAVLLTQKTNSCTTMDYTEERDIKDLFREEWKRVMVLSDRFWSRWRKEYLDVIQSRRKWRKDVQNIKEGDCVLLRDKTTVRNEWPLGRVNRVFESSDGKVRKTEIRVVKDGKQSLYIRPVTDLVLLL